ncbi:MAG: fluoride efflux transporter CrcB [Alphaproteobacteria bacterium]|nr:fluoride efflux transporter CrcB [Alphaproteobacteria bacterium]
MKLLLLAAVGGALGAGARHLVNVAFGRLLGSGFPWHTVFVNVVGSLAMGILIAALAVRFSGPLETRTFLATGVLGGFTTFSAFSLDFANLVERGAWSQAIGYAGGSVVLSIAALFVGLWGARAVLT